MPSPTNIQNVVVQNSTFRAKTLKIRLASAMMKPQATIKTANLVLNIFMLWPMRMETNKAPAMIKTPPSNCRGDNVSPSTR